LIEQLPDPDNRVTLAVDRPDALGLPRPRISYRLDAYALAGMAETRRVHDRIFGALGATTRRHAEERSDDSQQSTGSGAAEPNGARRQFTGAYFRPNLPVQRIDGSRCSPLGR
jgi:hypothetical protein